MKASLDFIDEIFDFQGLWGQESKCGLRIAQSDDKTIVVVTELYQLNPGSSVTQSALLLAAQICENFNIIPEKMLYFEHTPMMNSKLAFYDEEFYRVDFKIEDGKFVDSSYQKIDKSEYNFLK